MQVYKRASIKFQDSFPTENRRLPSSGKAKKAFKQKSLISLDNIYRDKIPTQTSTSPLKTWGKENPTGFFEWHCNGYKFGV